MALTKRQLYEARKAAVFQERSSWMEGYRDINRYLLPRNGRFLVSQRNKGTKGIFNNIFDNTATRANRVLSAGLHGGMTSPARPWFRLGLADRELMDYGPVKVWLNDVTMLMQAIFQKSNTYRALQMMYEELGGFGTGASIMLDDFQTVIHHYPLTVGEYGVAVDKRGEACALVREYDMTVANLVEEFGIESISPTAKSLYDKGSLDAWITVTHIIEPRRDRDPRIKDPQNMPYASCYYESNSGDQNKFLRESGYKRFPSLVARWSVTGGDIYGSGPGEEALGDIKQLMHEQLRKGQGIDYLVKPPVQLPTSMKNAEFNSLPGGASYVDMVNKQGIKNSFETRIDLQHLLLDIQDIRMRIEETFYKNLFLMLSNDDRSGITAREVAEKHEEKLLMIGPVLERLHNELLKRMIDMTFDAIIAAGIVPPPPPEMQGHELNVEFISMLAQAQRAIATGSIDRYVLAMGQIAQLKPGVLDKFDEDEWADKYGDMLGVDPTLIVANDRVAIIRQQRSQQLQAQQKQQALAQAAETAKTASQAKTGADQNALTDIISNFSGYGGPGQPYAA